MSRRMTFIALSVLLFACNSADKMNGGDKNMHGSVTYTRYPYFGKCPEFKMEIFDNGQMTINGIRNVDFLGMHHSNEIPEGYQTLNNLFIDSKFEQFSTEYLSDISDLPKIEIQYMGHKVVFHEREATKGLKVILDHLEKIRLNTHWMKK